MKTAPSKWAIGEPMFEWCQRNGLDATRIPSGSDAVTVRADVDGFAFVADVWHVLCEDDVPLREKHPDAKEFRNTGYEAEYLRTVPVDSHPPLNPEWVALFGVPDGWPDAPESARE